MYGFCIAIWISLFITTQISEKYRSAMYNSDSSAEMQQVAEMKD